MKSITEEERTRISRRVETYVFHARKRLNVSLPRISRRVETEKLQLQHRLLELQLLESQEGLKHCDWDCNAPHSGLSPIP